MKDKAIGILSLSGITLIIGIFFLFSGIKGIFEVSMISRDYETTEGYLYDYEIYSEGDYNAAKRRHTNDTYRLIYQYYVDGYEYKVSTDMGFGMVPEIGSVKEIQYNPNNPSDAFISGPNSNTFKIFFGLFFVAVSSFFIWILIPKKKKTDKISKKTSIDVFGVILGFGLLIFSYGCLFFMTGERSIVGIVNFYRTSFIIPMIVPILLLVVGGYLFLKSIFLNHKIIAHVCMFVGVSFFVIMIGFILLNRNENPTDQRVMEKIDFAVVHTMLSERGFETANIPTTYWFYDENKLTNVVSGIKDDIIFEFYEYTDGKTTDGVYNSISYDISQDMEIVEREKYETELQNGGKMFELIKDGTYSVVMYKNNVVIYARSPEEQNEIQNILIEFGYLSLLLGSFLDTEELANNPLPFW